MPTLDAIAEAGPWVVLVFVLMGGIAGLWTSVWKGLLVPGYAYQRMERKLDAAEAEVKAQAKTIQQLTLQLARERRVRATDRTRV